MTPDYESLRLLGWALLVFSLIGFAITEGIGLGAGALLTLVSRQAAERRLLIASIAPTSYLQQSWMIAVIALLFAVWPLVYAVGLACLQPLLLPLVLLWLIRPLNLLFRNAAPIKWQERLDKLLSYTSILAILALGLIVGNVIKGIPFHIDDEMHIVFLGDIWALLNLFTLLVAACCGCLLLFHGALFLQLDAQLPFADSCRALALKAGIAFSVLFILIGLWISRLEGYHISSEILTGIASNPLLKFVKRGEGLWLDNYQHQITLWLLPGLVWLGTALGIWFNHRRQAYWAFLSSCVAMACSVLTTALTLFPFILPSNRSLNTSLTLWDASTSQANLTLLLPLLGIGLMLMALLSRWAYRMPNQLSDTGSAASCSRHDA